MGNFTFDILSPFKMKQSVPYLLEVLVTVDVLLVMGVLQLVGLDVLPEGLDDAGAGLRVNAKQASQARVQLKLGRLWRRCNRITTLFFFFFKQPPTSEPLHQLRHIRQPYRVSPPARKRMSGFDSGAFTMQLPHVSGGYQRCEACRLSPQPLVSRRGLVTKL